MNSSEQTTEHFDTHRASQARKKGFLFLLFAIIIVGGGYSTYWYFIGSRFVSTDNAYAAAEIAEVTPAVGGIIASVNVVDTQYVDKGDVLVHIDDTDARLALSQAEADLALAKRRVRSYLANDEGLTALVEAQKANEQRTKAQLSAAQANFERAKIDLTRREGLVRSGSVSGEELSNAQTGYSQALANLHAAQAAMAQAKATKLSSIGSQKANAALTDNTTVENNPEVLLAKARLEQAKIDLERTIIRAPISGVVAKRQVQVGRRVQVGMPLMTVVPINQIYVDANFKEVELREVKIGQPVTLTADLYGDDVTYHGVIAGFSGGTGSAFSMIPAQNATGNWIKVVQRLPVRIELDPKELQSHPLQVGLSMIVTIDTAAEINAQTLVQYRATQLAEQG
ncbi:HlyD family efflux transporter periplasmic adaptor subunit [Vibrio sp. V27_P1S3P104]|uniref:HlyD family secretion protein n=1 Tax=Vibrio TaxID=662 RepID=UPI000C1735F9|nr:MULTISPECIES: HlyD family secretion protein [Vibrio]NAW70483.1 HlyD family efflux transporter periplasmic adaptor subunit [Vibrio sp. V28_P6S34P95]NAX04115.1 HlyD family efflux transporter periplasmic adaptor subunit [Vibrio sp. V30_P3S12P165]NAX34298.1 HlyD family efflux transporter periplasmic adaptor subunit [Vibrio sp. V29_P1S30P107]NAX37555.1 HlyD family efflux transporter periplasmic adaptor subunit [Vibrio sp. V27_P1S3P104]NAX40709.1 HlyD family efflux transporter periplasmic adaptor